MAKGKIAEKANADINFITQLYETMYKIRCFEQKAIELFKDGVIKGTAHSYIGEEAIASGTCLALREDDYIGSNHRGHGHCIAKGANLKKMMAELMGRDSGYCHGLGGSMHIADLDLHILGANGIVGGAIPLCTGAALAAKMRGKDQVVVCFFGDGASNQGVFHESLNLASVWDLPIIYICENNHFAQSANIRRFTHVKRLSDRAAAYGIPGQTIDGNDAEAVYLAVSEAVERARVGKGPTLLEAVTWRWGTHSMRSSFRESKTEEEDRKWLKRDPIARIEKRLARANKQQRSALIPIKEKIEEELLDAVEFGFASPEPSVEFMLSAVYSPHIPCEEPRNKGSRIISFVEAINEALRQEMEGDPSVFVMGEDIAEAGGIFHATEGLVEQFGRERVRDTPISEAGFCGVGIGAAIAGMRPIVEVQLADFMTLMMDMIVNQAAKFRYMLGGSPTVPVVIRGPQGGGIRLAAQHSQSLEAWFAHVPGLVVIAPSSPFDAKGLLISAIRDNNPVIFLEHKYLYQISNGPVPEEPYLIPIGKANVVTAGSDVTVVATQVMVSRAQAAAVELKREGISVEVIDPRTLRPIDEETIFASVRKTHRLVVVHEGWKTLGFGAEIAAMVAENIFDSLDAPIVRIGALDVPMPYNDNLERTVIPTKDLIVKKIKSLF